MSKILDDITDMEIVQEEWRKIPDFELYEVSDRGRVRRSAGRILSPCVKEDGYVHIRLIPNKGLKAKSKLVHHLVAAALYPNVIDYDEVHHKDHNPSNNAACNIEKVSKQTNRAERWNGGVINQGVANRRAVLQCDKKTGDNTKA